MPRMITFILNDTEVRSSAPHGMPLLEVIRRDQQLKGTKLACGEGECGACSVLVGALTPEGVRYHAVTSCITPIANIHGKHVVTIEGLRAASPGPVHRAMIACNGTQCGFCTPGFVVAMTAGLLNTNDVTNTKLIAAIDGNICRCTGYKSIERAVESVVLEVSKTPNRTLYELIRMQIVPSYFNTIEDRLRKIDIEEVKTAQTQRVNTGGGTDLFVQKPYEMRKASLRTMMSNNDLLGISINNNTCSIGTGETMSSLQNSPVLQRVIPDISDYFAPIGSTQIRNMATVGGNLVNASPIGDLTIMFLGLDATIVLEDGGSEKSIKLKNFYLGYKKLVKDPDSVVLRIEFDLPASSKAFHFERVCKRTYLDVASVNSACTLACNKSNMIQEAHLSAGGVAPIPLYLSRTSDFLRGKQISHELILEASRILQDEVSPISDIRGSAEYKRLLLRQLFFIHMAKLSPVPVSMPKLIRA